jgi:hypothetical protein
MICIIMYIVKKWILHAHRVGRVLSFFLCRRNWDSPTPLAAGECAPPPRVWGEGHTRRRERGWDGRDEGTYTVVLFICKYFVFMHIRGTTIFDLLWRVHLIKEVSGKKLIVAWLPVGTLPWFNTVMHFESSLSQTQPALPNSYWCLFKDTLSWDEYLF